MNLIPSGDTKDNVQIDPIPQLRDLLQRALRVKGQFSYPGNVNLSKIQPVFVINPEPIPRVAVGSQLISIAGVPSASIILFDTVSLNVLTAVLNTIRLRITLDVLGRAAFGADRIDVFFELIDRAGVAYQLMLMVWQHYASAGIAEIFDWNNNWRTANSYASVVGEYNYLSSYLNFEKLIVQSPYSLKVNVSVHSGGNFPANSTLQAVYTYSY
jgi:hypothetical protein